MAPHIRLRFTQQQNRLGDHKIFLPVLGLTCERELGRQRAEWTTLLLRPEMWWEGAEKKCTRAAASWDASLERQGGGEDA